MPDSPTMGEKLHLSQRSQVICILLVVCATYLTASLVKVGLVKQMEEFNTGDDTALFSTESALQYRLARMVAHGESIPRHDPKVQAPQGIYPWREWTVTMELAEGWMYRVAQRLGFEAPVHVFLIYCVCFLSTASMFPVYFLSRDLWGNRAAALAGAAIYAFALPTFSRELGTYTLEHFALPWLFLATWAALRNDGSATRSSWTIACIAGVAVAVALCSWFLSQFYLLMLVVAVFAEYLWRQKAECSRTTWALLAGAVVAGFAASALRAKGTLWSAPVLLLVALLVTHLIAGKWTVLRRRMVGIGTSGLALGVSVIVASGTDYGHVQALLLAKVRFLGIKPADPSLLSYEARSMWIEAFNSPSLFLIASDFIVLLPLGLAGAYCLIRARRQDTAPQELAVLLLASMFLVLFLLIERMSVFLAFFLAVLAGGVLVRSTAWARRIAAAVLVAGLLLEVHGSVNFWRPTPLRRLVAGCFPKIPNGYPNWQENTLDLLRFTRRHTPPDAVFLGRIGTSATLVTDADRAIAVHSKYESPGLRRKVRLFVEALFDDEDSLYRFCRDNEVDYVLYEAPLALDRSPDSERYLANALTLKRDSAAYKLHFETTTLRHFTPVYQNPYYRLFKVHQEGDRPETRDLPYQPVFDLAVFEPDGAAGEVFDDCRSTEIVRKLSASNENMKMGMIALWNGRPDEAIRILDAVRRVQPNMIGLHAMLGYCLLKLNKPDLALQECRLEVQNYPDLPMAHYNLGYVHAQRKEYEQARSAWETVLRLDPDDQTVQQDLARLGELDGG